MERLLIVNADDFGYARDVNEGIVEAHRHGILTAATLMANGAAFEHAVALARQTPSLDVGCHLVLVGGRSVLPPYKPLPASVGAFLRAAAAGRLRIYDELSAQVRKVIGAGVTPTHLDTHKHTHLLPPVLDAVGRIAREYGIRWVRRPFDFPLGAPGAVPFGVRATSRGLGFVRNGFHRTLARYGCRTTDHFAGFQITGRFRVEELRQLIGALPAGITELMSHPGYCQEELRSSPTRLKESREQELAALIAPEVRREIEARGVRLVRYRDLS